MTPVGDPRKRYYPVIRSRSDGITRYALVEAIPDADKPDNPDKDGKDGPVLLEAEGNAFWAEVNGAGFAWVDRGFKRFWVWNPAAAERARAGQAARA